MDVDNFQIPEGNLNRQETNGRVRYNDTALQTDRVV